MVKVKENPSGDFRAMHSHLSKGAWTFSDQDQGWQVSDCTAEGLLVSSNCKNVLSKGARSITNSKIMLLRVRFAF